MHGRLALLVFTGAFTVGCLSSGAIRPDPFPRPPVPAGVASIPASVGDSLVDTATGLTGVRYRPGGDTPSGFDCSGFTRYVFAQHGVTLPRLTREQYRVGQPITTGEVRPGDLVFFTTVAPGASHVGVAINRDEFVHAPSERGVVRVERLHDHYWASRYLGARRIVE